MSGRKSRITHDGSDVGGAEMVVMVPVGLGGIHNGSAKRDKGIKNDASMRRGRKSAAQGSEPFADVAVEIDALLFGSDCEPFRQHDFQ